MNSFLSYKLSKFVSSRLTTDEMSYSLLHKNRSPQSAIE